MQKRSNFETVTIDELRGLDQSVDEVKLSNELTPWSRGGYFDEAMDFHRRRGKLLHSSASTGGHILTIKQLSFVEAERVLIHQSESLLVEDDVSSLTAPTADDVGSPLEPFIF